jgi:hypothetical protein
MSVAFKAFHCMPVRSTSRMASMALRSSPRGRWHPSGWLSRGTGMSGSSCTHNQSGILHPSSRATMPMTGTSCSFKAGGRPHASYRDWLLAIRSKSVQGGIRSMSLRMVPGRGK